MRRFLLLMTAAFLYYSGLVRLAHWWHRYRGPCLVILNYHRASGGDLRRHLLYLRRHYRILHLEAALEELYAPVKEKQGVRRHRTLLALTFDDGYPDNYTHAFPLACELEIPITIFLIPGYVQSGRRFWWLEGKWLAAHARLQTVTLNGRVYHLAQPRERQALAFAIDTRLRNAPSVEEREASLVAIRQQLGIAGGDLLVEECERSLTWEQVREMEQSAWVSFGAHTMRHPILAALADPQEARREVEECRVVLEQQLGHPVRTLAYPVGQPQHLRTDTPRIVKQAGYDWALTTIYGINTPQSDPYLLRRIEVATVQHWLVMAVETAGLWSFFSRLRKVPFIRKNFTATSWK
jgi:peptidoglycan/xylan/chitin deacetylase (PgdA/CDA1 family)